MDGWKESNPSPADEELDEEELIELVLEAQREALSDAAKEKPNQKSKPRFPKWIFWLISIFMIFNTFSFSLQIYPIPAIEFLKTSAKLSADKDIQLYKKSVVTITTGDSKGTGFSVSNDGTLLTNYHVIEGHTRVTVAFPDAGRFTAKVVRTFPSIDLAVLKINGTNLPYLDLAKHVPFVKDEPIHFIGNPLNFHGIANEGTIIDTIKLSDWEEEVVMMKAPVYRGNSGSPVFNEDGMVIGVVFATLDHEVYGNVGLLIPIHLYYEALKNPI
ncbi:serine protease [Filibacter tadaridae]|uniref:Serine protease HtrA n=1 Tax=Filibacter tadaridae TaxID=2483811 RepID=A0A3P5XP78_9BACL|nr:serine protease [Filibacter tadaridae]VDC29621.1 Putative serine protease HtrA [Filibacter tadaridae]